MEENKKNSQNSHSTRYAEWPAEWQELVRLVYAGRFRYQQKPIDEDNPIAAHEQAILAALLPNKVLKDVLYGHISPSQKPSFAQIKDSQLNYSKEEELLKNIIRELAKQIYEFEDQMIKFKDYYLRRRDQERLMTDELQDLSQILNTKEYDLNKMVYGLTRLRLALDKLSEKAKVDPSLKDKGRAANKKPNNIFKEVRRGFCGLSPSGGDKDSLPSPKLASEKDKVLAQEGDKSFSGVRRVLTGTKIRVKKIPQTIELRTKLVKDAPKEVEAERPNLRSLPNLGKAAEILVDKVKQDKDYLPSPKPASEKAKVDHPSFKDKGRADTEQPNNKLKGVSGVHGDLSPSGADKDSLPSPASEKAKVDPSLKDKGRTATEEPNKIFKGVRRDKWGLSPSGADKGYRPKSFLTQARTKHKIFNPLKQLVAEHRIPDALKGKELEPAKHPEILVPDAVKRPVLASRRQKPASDIFSKSFYRLIISDNRLISNIDPLEKLRQPKRGAKIGDRKYFPAASTEWKNSIYVYNRNALYKNLPVEWLGKSLSMWVKLSNSGDTLKLLIPNNIRKVICGWTNHSCKVISQKILEKGIGNRGSKSTVLRNVVKEQRVDDSWGINFIPLRCTLPGSFARNTWVKIPSNPIINKWRTYMSKATSLDPWFVTGFADAESSFTIVFRRNTKLKSGWSVAVRFQLNLSDKDLSLLERIQSYFNGVGSIFTKEGEKSAELQVPRRGIKIVIDHFVRS
jgi:hypothetical protein